MVTHIAIVVWINRVWLPVLLVVCRTGKNNISLSALFAPENLASGDGFGSPGPRQPPHLHTLAESGAYYGITPKFRDGVHIFISNRHTPCPEFIGSRNCVPMAFTAESPLAQGQ